MKGTPRVTIQILKIYKKYNKPDTDKGDAKTVNLA